MIKTKYHKLLDYISIRKKRKEKKLLFKSYKPFLHNHNLGYHFILQSRSTLPAMSFLFFRLAELRRNIRVTISDEIIDKYNPHIHRWHQIGCLEFVGNLNTYEKNIDPNWIIIEENQNSKFITLEVYTNENLKNLLPYTLHPHQVFTGKLFFLNQLRENKRKLKIFFSGNFIKTNYDKSFSDYPEIINRYSILTFIDEEFKDFIDSPTNTNEIISSNNLITWPKWSHNLNVEVRIDEHDWLKIISSANFMLCPPGVYMPMCHNIIESMAVGTIPITQYGYLFDPPLTNNINCIQFDSLKELKDKILELSSLPENRISEMRQNVIDYFDKYIDPKGLIDRIEKGQVREIQYFKEY